MVKLFCLCCTAHIDCRPHFTYLCSLRGSVCCWPGLLLPVSKLCHHILEFVEVDHTVAVEINFTDDLLPNGFISSSVLAKNFGDFTSVDRATTISVKEVECLAHVLLVHDSILVHGGGAPLCEINLTTAVGVRLAENFSGTLFNSVRVLPWIKLLVGSDKFFYLDQSVTIFIELGEGLAHLCILRLGCQVSRQVRHSSLHHLRVVLHT